MLFTDQKYLKTWFENHFKLFATDSSREKFQ